MVLHSIYLDCSQSLFYLVSQEKARNSKCHCQAARSATFNLCSQFYQVLENDFLSNYTLQGNKPEMTEKDLSLNNRRKMRKPIESQNKQITSETNKSKVSKQLFLVPALLGGNLLLSAKAAFYAPNTQHWTLNTKQL